MLRSRSPVLATVVAGALALGGCGAGAITPAQYVARADAICAHTLAEVRTGAGLAATPQLVQARYQALARLPRPAARRTLLNRFLAAERAEIGLWQRLVAASRHPSQPLGIDRALAALAGSPASDLARAYGIRDCVAARGTIGSN